MSHGSLHRVPEPPDRHPRSSATGSMTASDEDHQRQVQRSHQLGQTWPARPIPLCPTVYATAAPMPMGANFITMPVNLNIISASDSQKPSIASLERPLTCDSATAKRIEKKTIWRTSLLAAASKKLCGTVCSSTPERVV